MNEHIRFEHKEIREIYADEILAKAWPYFVPDAGEDIKLAFQTGDERLMEKTLRGVLDALTSYHNLGTREESYHSVMDGVNASVSGDYRVRSDEESGQGRDDLSYEPRN